MYLTQVSPIDSQERPPRTQVENSSVAGLTLDCYGEPTEGKPARAVQSRALEIAQLTASSRLAQSIDYMRAHLNEPMRICTLCAIVKLSPSRFFELFKRVTGDTPLNWIIRARMRWAGELLENSTLQIKEVAWRVGYEDPFYFSRLFKSVHGISPSKYRTQKATGICKGGVGIPPRIAKTMHKAHLHPS